MRDRLRTLAISLRLDGVLKIGYVQGRMAGETLKFFLNGRPALSTAVVLAGSGRSGTTWVADMLTEGTGLQQIYEPLHPMFVSQARVRTGFDGRDPYLRLYYLQADNDDFAWRQFWADVLEGKVRNYWTNYGQTAWFPDRFLIKTIRANLMLGYLYDQFCPQIVYLTRHPCAVVYSRLRKVPVPWHADVSDILSQDLLVEDYLRPWVAAIERERDLLGAQAVWYAVENMVSQRELATRRHYALSYEALSLDPEAEMERLFTYLGIDAPCPNAERLAHPSRMTTTGSFVPSPMARLSEWQNGLDATERRRILDWAHRLGVCTYDDRILPCQLYQRAEGASTP